MKHIRYTHKAVSLVMALVLITVPIKVRAAEPLPANMSYPQILITELSPGMGDSKQEFIELYNATDHPISFADGYWQIQIATSGSTNWNNIYRKKQLTGVIGAGQFYIIGSTDYADASSVLDKYSYGLGNKTGHVRLVYSVLPISTGSTNVTTVSQLEWSTVKSDGSPESPSIDALNGGQTVLLDKELPLSTSIKRILDGNNLFKASGTTAQDFKVTACATPHFTAVIRPAGETASPLSVPKAEDDMYCEADTPVPEELDGQQPPQTVTPVGEPPVTILEPEQPLTQEKTTSKGPLFPATDIGLASPHITELLPNPASPQTDAADEFIELYNSNDKPFDLSGFKLAVGLTASRSYTFPQGTTIMPKSFAAFFSQDTKLALSNTSSQVRLLDPFGNVIAQSDLYSTAKDGQAWVLANGSWQWTTSPTPQAANIVKVPVAKASKASSSKTAAKTTLTSAAASSKKTAAGTAEAPLRTVSSTTPTTPLHPAMLALVGVFALLYGIYEYRSDLANKLYQLRAHRAVRRSLRQSTKGR